MEIVLNSDPRHGVLDLGEPWPWGEKLSNCVANQVEDTEPDGCLSDKIFSKSKRLSSLHLLSLEPGKDPDESAHDEGKVQAA